MLNVWVAVTGVGGWSVAWPLPSAPQQSTAPSGVSAHECWLPAVTCVYGPGWSSAWPSCSMPQQSAAPAGVSAQVWAPPVAMAV